MRQHRFGALALLVICAALGYLKPGIITRRQLGIAVLGGVAIVSNWLLLFAAYPKSSISIATTVYNTQPFMLLGLGALFLGEKITVEKLAWLALAFGGMLLIVRPGGGLDPLGVFFLLCNICATLAYYLLSRVLAHSEKTLALLFYSSLAGAVCFGLATPWFLNGEMPDGLQIALFLSLGIFAGVGHFFFTAAYRFAEASLIAPVSYVHLVWAGLLGWVIFGHVPDLLAIVGMLVVILAGVLVAFRSLRLRHSSA